MPLCEVCLTLLYLYGVETAFYLTNRMAFTECFWNEIGGGSCAFRLVFWLKNVSFAVETKHEERNNGNSVIANRHRLGR